MLSTENDGLSSGTSDIAAWRGDAARTRLLELAINSATNAIAISDVRLPDRPLVYINRAFESMTGYLAKDVLGKNCRFLQGADTQQPEIGRLRDAISRGVDCEVVIRNYCKDGTLFWNSLRVAPLRDSSGTVTHFIGIQTDVTALKRYEADLEHRANYDALTGLPNKNLLDDRLRQAIGSTTRTQWKLAVLYVDASRLKAVNDSLGHASGDAMIQEIARRLRKAVRVSDTVARITGDEFVVVLNNLTQSSALESVAQKLVAELAPPIVIGTQEIFVSPSIGISVFPEDGAEGDALLRNANSAALRAERGGRSQIAFFTADLHAAAQERLKLDADIRRALRNNEFELHYQPRVQLATDRITSLEALLRWKHPAEGWISPARFIGIAEETGVIVPLGMWVLRTACAQMVRWRDAGRSDIRIAVNLSPRQFRQPDLLPAIRQILDDCGLAASNLELEITESSAMHDPEATEATLRELRALGIELAIDDFGTGYSSLAYLKRFPIDYLKIDQSFIRGLPGDRSDDRIVRAIIALGKSLDLSLIAEGVETGEQRALLQAYGCDQMQGYLFCRPIPAEQLDALLLEQRP